ncbi:MAG: hypothetical protein AMJ54_07560 [Deltaproteobacteria bacterium SG8_13]|nr:MAG: hypothetical protein AMJ54_07560 [Deltaproteobacteria bacterium SG8_13]
MNNTKWKKWLLLAAASIAAAGVLTVAAGVLWFHRAVSTSQPMISGTAAVSGLVQSVEIIRDEYGVPHITAANEPDLYFGMGYAMAQDRLWQMEFMRRLGQGRLAEILGADLLPVDRFFRTLSAGTNLEPRGDPYAFATAAFSRGINAFLQQQENLPLEFRLLGYRPEPWTDSDYIAVLRVMNWGLSFGWKADLTAARMLETVGEEKLKDAFPHYPSDAPLIVTPDIRYPKSVIEPVAEQIRKVSAWLGPWGAAASNNWVISGQRSVSGKPVLANDTHLELSNPSAWWEVHLTCPTLDAAGFSIPGLPGLAVGHNRHAAWGVTTVMADDVDFYIERIDPSNPRRYWRANRWETMHSVKETIRIKGEAPVVLDILFTHHGPVFSAFEKRLDEQTLSVRWTGREVIQTVAAVHRIAQAKNITDIVTALRDWHMPGQNFVFADTEGNIGYWCSATIPVRNHPFGLLPVPGWLGDYEWGGWIPFDQRPHEINPSRGFIASANNRVAGSGYPFHIGTYWEPQDRIARIHQLLDTGKKLSPSHFKQMQSDVTCLLASELTPLLTAAVEKRDWDEGDRQAVGLLANWDYRMNRESPAACLFETVYHRLLQNIFGDDLEATLFDDYMKSVVFPPRALRHIIRSGDSAWIDDIRTKPVEALDDIIDRSLRQALDDLRRNVGAEPSAWRWGRRHTLTFEHVLGKKKPLDRLFAIGPFPVGGNHLTVNKSMYHYADPFAAYHGASQRMIVDLASPQTAWHVLPTGQSGLLGNAHHQDQVELYLNGEYRQMRLNRADVEAHAQGKLLLVPAAGDRNDEPKHPAFRHKQ